MQVASHIRHSSETHTLPFPPTRSQTECQTYQHPPKHVHNVQRDETELPHLWRVECQVRKQFQTEWFSSNTLEGDVTNGPITEHVSLFDRKGRNPYTSKKKFRSPGLRSKSLFSNGYTYIV